MNPDGMLPHRDDASNRSDDCYSCSCGNGRSDSCCVSAVHEHGASGDRVISASRDPQQPPRRSVRFSSVRVREYSVVEESASASGGGASVSLGWEYIEKGTCDLQEHLDQAQSDRDVRYQNLIQSHIQRAENQREKRQKKEKGFRSKVLKPLWKDTLAAASRFAVSMPVMYH